MSTPAILITGANGFVGTALCAALLAQSIPFRAAQRTSAQMRFPDTAIIPSLDGDTPWQSALAGCSAVVHIAARAHVMRESAADPLTEFRRVNVEATLNLARQASAANIKRFIFISTAKVIGEGQPFAYTDSSLPAPHGPYAQSKWEAEQGLQDIAARTGMEVVILRPPLIYGPGVKANFLNLMRRIHGGWPLPLGGIANRRSLLGLDNMVDVILTCLRHPAAANRHFLIADAEPLSTPALAHALADALACRARLFTIPRPLLFTAGSVLRKRAAVDRLLGSFEIDMAGITHTLGWTPPHTTTAMLKSTADWFRAEYLNPTKARPLERI